MRRIWWVMGASAVGKKTLMRAAVADLAVRETLGLRHSVDVAWMNDGPITPEAITAVATGQAKDTLIRWQFGREAWLGRPCWGAVEHGLLLVVADADVHYDRVQAREGARWTPEMMSDEAKHVRRRAAHLARRCRLTLRIVDVTDGYRLMEEARA